MYRFEHSKKFNGVNFILSEDELNKWLVQLDSVIDRLKDDEEESIYVDKLRSLRRAIVEFSYFDLDDREVHCRLGFYEMELMIECITKGLPYVEKEDGEFGEIIARPETKIWKNS